MRLFGVWGVDVDEGRREVNWQRGVGSLFSEKLVMDLDVQIGD